MMEYLRTPDEQFQHLPGFTFQPNYRDVTDLEGNTLRMHYLDEGPENGPVVLMMHGEPSWCYLYRKMIPLVTEAGFRVIAPDLIGFGRSDKPVRQKDYSHPRHNQWVYSLIDQLGLNDISLMCQDWGGLIGLRLVADYPDRFARILAANTMLPGFPLSHPQLKGIFGTGEKLRATLGFGSWYLLSQIHPFWKAGDILKLAAAQPMSKDVQAAYNAPFPSRQYMAGARVFPRLVPSDLQANKQAWKKLMQWEKPFLCAFSDKDPIMSSMAGVFTALIPGCNGQAHTTIRKAGHFLQEDQGEQLARVLVSFILQN